MNRHVEGPRAHLIELCVVSQVLQPDVHELKVIVPAADLIQNELLEALQRQAQFCLSRHDVLRLAGSCSAGLCELLCLDRDLIFRLAGSVRRA